MRLLQSVLSRLKQTKKPQYKFVTHLLGLLLMLPGHATFRNMSRYSPYHEKTFSRWYGSPFDWVSLNKAAITYVVPAEHEQAMVMDASFVPKSGQQPMAWVAFGTAAIVELKKGLKFRPWPGSISPAPALTRSVWSRHRHVPRRLIQRPPAWMSMWTNSAACSLARRLRPRRPHRKRHWPRVQPVAMRPTPVRLSTPVRMIRPRRWVKRRHGPRRFHRRTSPKVAIARARDVMAPRPIWEPSAPSVPS